MYCVLERAKVNKSMLVVKLTYVAIMKFFSVVSTSASVDKANISTPGVDVITTIPQV